VIISHQILVLLRLLQSLRVSNAECIRVCCRWSVLLKWLRTVKRSWWKFSILSLVISS